MSSSQTFSDKNYFRIFLLIKYSKTLPKYCYAFQTFLLILSKKKEVEVEISRNVDCYKKAGSRGRLEQRRWAIKKKMFYDVSLEEVCCSCPTQKIAISMGGGKNICVLNFAIIGN